MIVYVKEPCSECHGTGQISRKVWEDIPASLRNSNIHPSVLAGIPAQRTIKVYPCPRGCMKPLPRKEPIYEAEKLVVHLGWDWWDAVNELEHQSDIVLETFIRILSAEDGKDTARHKALSRIGIRGASLELQSRAFERARLADDGCPLF